MLISRLAHLEQTSRSRQYGTGLPAAVQRGRIGLDLVVARLAPHDEPAARPRGIALVIGRPDRDPFS